jgi:hypothetical protein
MLGWIQPRLPALHWSLLDLDLGHLLSANYLFQNTGKQRQTRRVPDT